MKKLWLALALVFLLTAASAYADKPVGGLLTFRRPTLSMQNAGGTDGGFDISMDGLVTGTESRFEITGLPDGYTSAIAIGVDWTDILQGLYNVGWASQFTYTFLEPSEDYFLFVFDTAGNTVDWKQFEVTGRDYVKEKAEAIIARCPSGDDFEKAVWLHDYLALNSYYDSTLVYHGRDHILVDGYGVCQSYSEAYRMLCRMAGINCEIVVSNSMNHEWNAIKLDGKWYEVDATWDSLSSAPAGEGTPADICSHVYFALTDKLLRRDHKGHSVIYTSSGPVDMMECVYMDDNYFVRRGQADEWAESLMPQVDRIMDSYSLSEAIDVTGVTFNDAIGDADERFDIAAAAAAIRMDGTEHSTPGGVKGTLSVKDLGYGCLLIHVLYKDMWTAVLEGITDIGEEAFAGTNFQKIEIGEGCETIGARAFAGCKALRNITIPASVTSISDDVFADCQTGQLRIIAPFESYAANWAKDNGFNCILTIP